MSRNNESSVERSRAARDYFRNEMAGLAMDSLKGSLMTREFASGEIGEHERA